MHRAVVALLALAAPAAADPVVLDEHQLVAAVSVELDLGGDQAQNPIAIAPDLWWGVTPRWTVGLIHSNRSLDRIDAGASLCVHECDQLYHDVGLDVRYAAIADVLAPRVRFVMRSFDPAKPALTLGALARWSRGRWSITGDPYVQLGLANRDRGNRSELVLPVWFGVVPADRFALALHTGYFTDVVVWRDGYHVPVGVDATWHATPELAVDAEFGFSSALGPQNNSKERVLVLTLTFASAAPARASRGSAAADSPASRD